MELYVTIIALSILAYVSLGITFANRWLSRKTLVGFLVVISVWPFVWGSGRLTK